MDESIVINKEMSCVLSGRCMADLQGWDDAVKRLGINMEGLSCIYGKVGGRCINGFHLSFHCKC